MSQTLVERTAEQIGKSARQASRATSAIADAIKDSVEVGRRAAKQGGDAAEEFLDDTTPVSYTHLDVYKRQPWSTYAPIDGPGGGLYRSKDAGKTWSGLNKGLPEGDWGRVGVDVAPDGKRCLLYTSRCV